MKINLLILLAIFFGYQFNSHAQGRFCNDEASQLESVIESFSSAKADRNTLISTFHSKIQMISQACSVDKTQDLRNKYHAALGDKVKRPELTYAFEPRKAVEIGTINHRGPASR